MAAPIARPCGFLLWAGDNENDPIVQLAEQLRRGEAPAQDPSERALTDLPQQSRYAQALGKALLYLRAADRFIAGQLDEESLKQHLDIGKPEESPDIWNLAP